MPQLNIGPILVRLSFLFLSIPLINLYRISFLSPCFSTTSAISPKAILKEHNDYKVTAHFAFKITPILHYLYVCEQLNTRRSTRILEAKTWSPVGNQSSQIGFMGLYPLLATTLDLLSISPGTQCDHQLVLTSSDLVHNLP